ncbi:MAG: FAD-binding oxidoreductase [Cytophagales bacterium]|nr:MAG: FAD-binding oxidoreductase [Cytophagales bacterium]
MKTYNYLIVGQGLAGTVLAYTLLKRNQSVFVIDDGYKTSASQVAAGIFNPITGMRMVKTWKADLLFPFLQNFYTDFESFLNTHFFFQKPIYRPFESIAQQNHVLGQSAEKSFSNFMNLENNDEHYKPFVFNEFGGVEIKNGGYIDVGKMLAYFRDFLVKENLFLATPFDEDKINAEGEIKDLKIRAEKIIFCRGFKDRESKFWSYLPFKAVKGEVLTGKFESTENLDFEQIINRQGWVLPLENSIYKVGSTYEWDKLDSEITEKAKSDILEKTHQLIRPHFKASKQEAGIRPATADRFPLMGLHKIYPNIGIFNGLGTKGVSIAPYFANHFADYLIENKALDKEVSIARCS